MFDTILVPLDGSKLAERALLYAPTLARGAKAQLLLLRVQDHQRPFSNGKESARSYLEAARGQLGKDLTVSCYVLSGSAGQVILDTAHLRVAATSGFDVHDMPYKRSDMILMATHGRTGFGRWIYGSVAEKVLSEADMPVMLVPPFSVGMGDGRQAQILVGLDGSAMAEEALQPASELATALNARLLVLRVVDAEAAVTEARAYLERALDHLPESVRARTDRLVEVGSLSHEVGRLVGSRNLDLVVLTTHGHSGRAEVLMGSAARSILQVSGIPVMLVRPLGIAQQRSGSGLALAGRA